MSTDQAFQAQAAHQDELLAKSNVVGVAVGFKESKGERTGEVAVVVLVQQKKPLAALSAADVIPRELEGMRTDVYEIGFVRAFQSPRDRFRPVIPSGVSIGHYKVTAGTLGTMVKDRLTGEPFILSNNHVLANSNDAAPGDDLIQPADLDGGDRPGDVVAQLDRYWTLAYIDDPVGTRQEYIKPGAPTPPPGDGNGGTTPPGGGNGNGGSGGTPPGGGTEPDGCLTLATGLVNVIAMLTGSGKRATLTQSAQTAGEGVAGATLPQTGVAQVAATNTIDCALGKPNDPLMFSDDILGIGVVNETMPAALGQRVRKSGRTTGLTEGNITLLNATVNVAYNTMSGNRTARFTGQIISEGMSAGGDSGSLVVDAAENKAVGLLFAGSELATIFTPITVVLDALDVTL